MKIRSKRTRRSESWKTIENFAQTNIMLLDPNQVTKVTQEEGEIRVVLIDNYDSFTYNVYQYLCVLGAQVDVYRNDKITVKEVVARDPTHIVISPGPGNPNDAGVSADVIKEFQGKLPILGVCLGEQTMFHMYGGRVDVAGEYVHGKTSPISHDGKGLFSGVPQQVKVMRYHSLVGYKDTLPDEFIITSETDNGLVMGIRHKTYTMEGVQFHPESILTEHGIDMIRNFLTLQKGTWVEEQSKPE